MKSGRNHGMSQTKTYRAWALMKERCSNKNVDSYQYYGARGITVCKRWRHSFINFLHDMGEKPPLTSLDRKNINRGYSKNNCQWSTIERQSRNKSTTIYLSAFGEKKSLPDWLDDSRCAVTRSCLIERLHLKWEHERALTVMSGQEKSQRLLLPKQVVKIRSRFMSGESITELSRAYNIARSSIRKIVHRRAYKNVA